MSSQPPVLSKFRFESQRGQVIVEYVLLLVVAVAMATIIVSMMVKRDPDNAGFLMQKWKDLQDVIGSDDPGKR